LLRRIYILTAFDSTISNAYFSDSKATITNSIISWLSLRDKADVAVNDSEIGSINIDINDATLDMTGLQGGYASSFSTSDSITVISGSVPTLTTTNLDMTLTFNVYNSSLSFNNCKDISILASENSSATGRDSNITSIAAGNYWPDEQDLTTVLLQNTAVASYASAYSQSIMTIYGSTLSWLGIEDQATVSVYDSSINGISAWNLNNSVLLSNVAVGSFSISESNFHLYGNFSSGYGYSSWYQSNVTRDFSVIVQDEAGNVVPNAALTLYDPAMTVVWSGYSDSFGKADFTVTFTDATNGFTLKGVKQDRASVRPIGFMSNSTVLLGIHLPTVHNLDTNSSYATIQDAIDAAGTVNGHTIFVEDGT